GRVGFFDTYPGIGHQGGTSLRAMASAALVLDRPATHAELRVYALARGFSQAENPDGFVDDPLHGDLLSERYAGGTVGMNGSWRRTLFTLGGNAQELETGVSLRHDRYTVAEQHLHAVTSQPLAVPDPMA